MPSTDVLPERAPERGELAQVRSRRWLVEDVRHTNDGSPIVSLACADDDAQGEELEVFWDYEIDRRILEEEGWADLAAKGFDDPRQFAAFLNTLKWNTRHRDGPEPLPGAVPRRHHDRRLPDGASAQGAPPTTRQPLHR